MINVSNITVMTQGLSIMGLHFSTLSTLVCTCFMFWHFTTFWHSPSSGFTGQGGTIYCCSDSAATDDYSSGLLFVLLKVPVAGSQPKSFVTVAFCCVKPRSVTAHLDRAQIKEPHNAADRCCPLSAYAPLCADADKYLIPFILSVCDGEK